MLTDNPIYRFIYIVSSFFTLTSFLYILPAVVCAVISWEFSTYHSMVTSPAYAALYGIFCVISTAVWLAEQVDNGKM